jgi:drug/metabolite transporter (DMT)-like permease
MARLALLAAPFCYVLADIYARRRLGRYPPFVIAAMLTPILLGGVFLGEQLSARDIAGALVIAIALVIIDGRALRLRRP